MNAEAIREALRCGRPGCECSRPRGKVHCPAHPDAHPSLSITERNGTTLVHCFSGCAQEEAIAALRDQGLWDGRPPAPRLSRTVRRQGQPVLEGPLADVVRFVRSYVILPSLHAELAVALWVAHSHALDAWDCSPYLVIKSPEKRSGKTRLLEVLELLVPRPWRVIQPSEAVLFRKLAAQRPVLLLDEADAIFNGRAAEQYEPLRAILNAGFRRGAVVSRCVPEGKAMQLVDFDVFGAKAAAVIGDLPDTVEDRAVVLRLDRATPVEQRRLRRLRFKEAAAEAAPLRDALARWAEAALPRLREARPSIPAALDGRAADAWEPLFAVAAEAGDGWTVVTWEAALVLSTGAARGDDSLRVRLLADVRRVFEEKGTDRIATAALLEALVEDETAPWGDLNGRRLTPQGLAQLLRPFSVAPTQWREGDQGGVRGYAREDFADALSRYLPSEPLQPLHARQGAGFSDFELPLQAPSVAVVENGATPDPVRVVAAVAVQTSGEGGGADAGPPRRRLRLSWEENRRWRVATPPEQVLRVVRAALERAGLPPRSLTVADVEAALGPVELLHDGPDLGPGPGWYDRKRAAEAAAEEEQEGADAHLTPGLRFARRWNLLHGVPARRPRQEPANEERVDEDRQT